MCKSSLFCLLHFHANEKGILRSIVNGMVKRIMINLLKEVMLNIIIVIINDL